MARKTPPIPLGAKGWKAANRSGFRKSTQSPPPQKSSSAATLAMVTAAPAAPVSLAPRKLM
jgi:hypothetical protein